MKRGRPSAGDAESVSALLAVLAVLLVGAVAPVEAQHRDDLGELYRQARIEALGWQRAFQRVAPVMPGPLHTPRLDALRALLDPAPAREEAEASPPAPLPRLRERRVVRRLERPVFEQRFSGVRWAYLGANGPAVLDTMQTRDLRARLQAHYGDPTHTVVDADSLTGRPVADYVQFEYWFVVNDAIPIKVVDTGGPFDRGVVFAAPARFRGRLAELRAALFAPLLETRLRARYVDYFFDADAETWYRAGFDGRRFFVESVPGEDVMPGRRPVLRRAP
jgi:hypothetical protein